MRNLPAPARAPLLLLFLLLLTAGAASAHFHEALAVARHTVEVTQEAPDRVVVEESILVVNEAEEPYAGRVYAFVDPDAEDVFFGPGGSATPPDARLGGGLIAYDLGKADRSLAPGEGLPVSVRYRVESTDVTVRTAYATRVLQVNATPLPGWDVGTQGGLALGTPLVNVPSNEYGAQSYSVLFEQEPLVRPWMVLLGAAALILAAGYAFDRWRSRRGEP